MAKRKKQQKRCDEVFSCCEECPWFADYYEGEDGEEKVRRHDCTRLNRPITDPQAFLPDCPLEDV
jgi:hypothetical protein